MPSDLQKLDAFFHKRLLRVPDYQRGYAWQQDQWEDFWRDLDSLGIDRKHYTGQVTVEKVSDSAWQRWDDDKWLIEGKAYEPFYVVDGQQRLTTVVILLKCIIDRMPEGGELALNSKEDLLKTYLLQKSGAVSQAFLFGYEKDNPSNEYLKTQILGERSNAYTGTKTTYTANLAGARDFFNDKLREATPETLERLFKALTQRFVFNVYTLEDDLDEFIVFETMNNRGKPLSKLELLKNRLIYLSTLYPRPEFGADLTMLRKNINEAWKTVYEYLGKVEGSPLDDDDFLRAHWIMYFTYSRGEGYDFATYLLKEKFTAEGVFSKALSLEEIQSYVDSIQESVRKWHQINFPELAADLPDKIRQGFERLARLGGRAFAPLAMAILQMSLSESQQLEFLEVAEQFVFLVGKLCRRRADVGDAEFYRLAHQVYHGDKALAGAIETIRAYTNSYFSVDKATAEIQDQREGFYSWAGLDYFLFEYEEHLREMSGMEADRLHWDGFTSRMKDFVTIEHIFPQTAVTADWPSFSGYSEQDSRALLHSLGNLLALSRSRNSKFSNRSFARKRVDEGGVQGYYNGSYSEIQVAKLLDWTPSSIVNRGLEMMEFLELRWGKPLGTREDKLKLLDLDGIEIMEAKDLSEPANSERGGGI